MWQFLHSLARKHKKSFVGSTSSVTCALSQVYYMISRFRKVQTKMFSNEFRNEVSKSSPKPLKPNKSKTTTCVLDSFSQPDTFTKFAKKPATVRLSLLEGVYAIDKPEDGESTILSELVG